MVRGVCLAGLSHVGKTESAKFLEDHYSMARCHVKSILGEMIAPMLLRLGITIDEMDDYIFGDKINDPLPGDPALTTRKLLQAQGGGFLLDLPDPMIAQRLAVSQFAPGVPIIIESLRYAREADWFTDNGFKIIRLIRPGVETGDAHKSENDQNFPVDVTIHNDSTLEDLYESLARAMKEFGIVPINHSGRSLLILVNGRPHSGKDTFVTMCRRYIWDRYHSESAEYSSIDPIRDVLTKIGIDVSAKTPEDRKLMSVLGQALEDHSHVRSVSSIRALSDALNDCEPAFLYVREKEMMDKIEQIARSRFSDIGVIKLWVNRPGMEHNPSNSSDNIDYDSSYDFQVNNDGTIQDLEITAAAFVDALFAGRSYGYFSSAANGKGDV
jgi:hypothetical protein